MRIRARLQMMAFTTAVLVPTIVVLIMAAQGIIGTVTRANAVAGDIGVGVVERITLRDHYLISYNLQVKNQWFLSQKKTAQLLKSASLEFGSVFDKKTLENLSRLNDQSGKVFSMIIANHEAVAQGRRAPRQAKEIEDRLMGQLLLQSYEMAADARGLADTSSNLIVSTQKTIAWVSCGGIFLVVIYFIFVAWSVGRIITKGMKNLEQGAKALSEGNLHYVIPIVGVDEFAQLAQTFNAMSGELARTYSDLQQEVKVRKEIDEARTRSEIDLARAQAISHVGSWRMTFGSEGERWWGSDELFSIYERPVAMTSCFDFLHGEDRDMVQDAWRAAINGDGIREWQHRILVNGRTKWVEVRVEFSYDQDGKPREATGTVQDITERKAVDGKLSGALAEAELFRDALNRVPVQVYLKDTRLRFSYANQTTLDFFGCSGDDLIGRANYCYFPAEAADRLRDVDMRVLAGEQTKEIFDFTDLKGERHVYLEVKAPVYEYPSREKIVGLLGISTDITERKQAEEELERYTNELDLRVNERTAQLETALHEQETFSYSVAHDLRSPLRSINGYLSILIEDFGDCLPPDARPLLDRSCAASITMGKLIDDLLGLSRVSRSELVKETVHLSDLATAILARLREMEPEREVETVITSGLTARGDKSLLNQVLENLIGNAWKYSSKEKKLRLELGKSTINKRRTFYIKDNGIGFDMEYHDKIFGVFQRLHAKGYSGNGIGLATVKRIIERHGGSVWATAHPDEGATFYFHLPSAQ